MSDNTEQNESAERTLNDFVMAHLDDLVDEVVALQSGDRTLDQCPLFMRTFQMVADTGVLMSKAHMAASHVVAAAGMLKYQALRDWLRKGRHIV